MLEAIPTKEQLTDMLGTEKYEIWQTITKAIEEQYEMETLWNSGGKVWDYEYKYRRAGKTLCALYARKNCLGVLIILGKNEREKFEQEHELFSEELFHLYQKTKTYHDGKWLMIKPEDVSLLDDIKKLLHIKRKPNKK